MKLQLALRQRGIAGDRRIYLLVGVAELPQHWPGEHFYPFSVNTDGQGLQAFRFRISKRFPPVAVDDQIQATHKGDADQEGPELHAPSMTPSQWLATPCWTTGDGFPEVFVRECRLPRTESGSRTYFLFGCFQQPYQANPLQEGLYAGEREADHPEVALAFVHPLAFDTTTTPESLLKQPVWGFGDAKFGLRTFSELSYLRKNQTAWTLAHRARSGEKIDRREYMQLKRLEEELGDYAWHRMQSPPDDARHFAATGHDLTQPVSADAVRDRAEQGRGHLQKLKSLIGDPSP